MRTGTGPQPLHSLRVRTATGDEWEVASPFIVSLELAVKAAILLRNYFRGDEAAQIGVPIWASDIASAIEDDGAEKATCVIQVHRGRPTQWELIASFEVRSQTNAAGRRRTA